jgi:hypothetical protein
LGVHGPGSAWSRPRLGARNTDRGRQLSYVYSASTRAETAKNRVYLDLRAAAGVPPEGRADALEAGCTRLVALGARRLRRLEADGINDVCIVMQDPRATSSASTEWARVS